MKKLNISTRLGLAFGLVLLITAGIALFSAWQLERLKTFTHQIASVELERSVLAQRWSSQINMNWLRASAAMKTSDIAYIESLQKDMALTSGDISKVQKQLEGMLEDDANKALMATVGKSRTIYLAARAELLKKKKSGANIMKAVDTELRPLADDYLKAVSNVAQFANESLTQVQARAEGVSTTGQWVIGIIATIAVAIGMALSFFVTLSITRPLQRAVNWAGDISKGNLTSMIEPNGNNEVARLQRAILVMQLNLSKVIGNVRENAEGVATASTQIANGNQDLSSRTEEQACALEKTAVSMAKLSSTVQQNADNAKQANQLALNASTVAIKGGEVVGQVVATMKGINDSSKKIADIISVIDSIAFQTNILALNAAVEAARAGEQGRGFAVVASEVRNLAGRSADAAKEIKGLINASVERVAQGSDLVDQAGNTMTEVVSAIKRVTDIMGEISAASAEQSTGVTEVGEAIAQMDQDTQKNAALVEESAAAAESLKSQAQQLVAAVAVFNLGSSETNYVDVLSKNPESSGENGYIEERRGPHRAQNVSRINLRRKDSVFNAALSKTGTHQV